MWGKVIWALRTPQTSFQVKAAEWEGEESGTSELERGRGQAGEVGRATHYQLWELSELSWEMT